MSQPCSSCHQQTKTTKVTLTVSTTSVKPGNSVRLSGKSSGISGSHEQKVTLKLSKNGAPYANWKKVARSFSVSWKAPTAKGTYKFQATYPGDNEYKPGASPVRTVKVT